MGGVSATWQSVRAGILLVLATRQASKLTSSNGFVASFVTMLAACLVFGVVQHELLQQLPSVLIQLDPIREVVASVCGLVVYFLTVVLATQVIDWFENTYMNGPYVAALALIIGLIIFLFVVVGFRFSRYSSANPRHVNHLIAIADDAADE